MNKNSNLPEVILRVELLRKGDVLLSRGRDPKSEVIAKFSGGQFSHAALCVSPQMTFESDMGVIGHRLIHILGTADVGKDRTTVGEAPGQPEYCAVYRHPMMSQVSRRKFAKALALEMEESFGKDYSELYRLVELSDLSEGVQSLAMRALRFWERNSEKIHGPFCSELVNRFFNRLGLPLFDDERPPNKVTPNALATASKLVLIEEACLHSKDVRLHDRALTDSVDKILNQILPMPVPKATDLLFPGDVDVLSHVRHRQRGFKRMLDRVSRTTNQVTETSRAKFKESLFQELEQVQKMVDETPASSAEYEVKRVEGVCCRYTELVSAALSGRKHMFSDVKRTEALLRKWRLAGRSLLRSNTLRVTNRLKEETTKLSEQPWSIAKRWKIRKARKKILKMTREVLCSPLD